ncbi:MAG: hypothetical protein NT128_01560 [Proteobacteria bacterium]|nr:hypothetical protein [Pseudomonadota bacterium]
MIQIAKIIMIWLAASPLMANIIWPGVYLHSYLFSLYSIVPALIIEWVAIKWIFDFTQQRALVIAIIINAVSAAIGYFIYLPLSFVYELGLSFTIHTLLRDGTFSHLGWVANYMFATIFTTLLEYCAARIIFKLKFPIKSKEFLWFLVANGVGVAISFVMMYYESQ